MSNLDSFIFGFILFGSTPLMAKVANKVMGHVPSILSLTMFISPYLLPLMAFAGFYGGDSQMGMLMSGASVGWWLALLWLRRKEMSNRQ